MSQQASPRRQGGSSESPGQAVGRVCFLMALPVGLGFRRCTSQALAGRKLKW